MMQLRNGPRAVQTTGRKWRPTAGESVELRRWGVLLRIGSIETVMPDGSGFWLIADGADLRLFIHIDYDDIEVWA